MKTYLTNSEKETKKIAALLSKQFDNGLIALTGELGTGKTTFVQGFAKGLGITEKIISPTFVLIRHHGFGKDRTLFHIDLYRLEDSLNIKELGLEEIWSNPKNLVLIEWAEKIEKLLPENALKIKIEKRENNARLITLS